MEQLTREESIVLRLVADGFSSQEISGRTSKSMTTVRRKIRAILRKLKAKNRTHAVLIAFTLGLLS